MLAVIQLPPGMAEKNPDSWTPDEWTAFVGVFWGDRKPVPRDAMAVGTWWYVLPGAGELFLAEAKAVDKENGFALLYSPSGRVFPIHFVNGAWL